MQIMVLRMTKQKYGACFSGTSCRIHSAWLLVQMMNGKAQNENENCAVYTTTTHTHPQDHESSVSSRRFDCRKTDEAKGAFVLMFSHCSLTHLMVHRLPFHSLITPNMHTMDCRGNSVKGSHVNISFFVCVAMRTGREKRREM